MFYYLTLDLKEEGIDRSEHELDPSKQKFKLKWTRAIYHFWYLKVTKWQKTRPKEGLINLLEQELSEHELNLKNNCWI